MSDESELELFNKAFNIEEKKPAGISFVGKGLIFTFFFWATFIIVWFGFSFFSSEGTYLRESISGLLARDNFKAAGEQFGLILGTKSPWDTNTAMEYLGENNKTILKKINYGTVVATMSLSPKSDENDIQTYSNSTEFNLEKKLAYSSFAKLDTGSMQIINDGEKVLVRGSASEKWISYKNLYERGFDTEQVSGKTIAETILDDWVINKHVAYKGTKNVDSSEHLLFSLSLNPDGYSNIFLTKDEPDPEKYFKSLKIDFEINPDKDTLEKFEIDVSNLFVGEKQFNIKKSFEYLELSSNKIGIESIRPKEEEITESTEDFEFTELLVNFFAII